VTWSPLLGKQVDLQIKMISPLEDLIDRVLPDEDTGQQEAAGMPPTPRM
jgi:hypothetical protein